MLHIEVIEDSYRVNLVQGEGLKLEFQFRDVGGTVRNASIGEFAVEALTSMLSDSQRALLQHVSEGVRGDVSMRLNTGQTRGECYISGTE